MTASHTGDSDVQSETQPGRFTEHGLVHCRINVEQNTNVRDEFKDLINRTMKDNTHIFRQKITIHTKQKGLSQDSTQTNKQTNTHTYWLQSQNMLTDVQSFAKTRYGLVTHPTINSRNNGRRLSSQFCTCTSGLHTDVIFCAKESLGIRRLDWVKSNGC